MKETVSIPELRFPEFVGEWKTKKFKKIYCFKTTNSYSRENLNYEKGVVKNIHYGDIHTKFHPLFDVTKEQVPYINEEIDISKIAKDCYLENGDLVIADASEDYNDIGKTIEVVNINGEKIVAGLHTFLAKRKSDEIVTGFATFLLKTRNIRLDVMRIAQGTKVLSISTKRLAEISLKLPNTLEQTKIANFLTIVDQRINLLTQQKEKLEQYKKGVMQQIFSQQIRFKDDDGNDFPGWIEKRLGEVYEIVGGGTPETTKESYWNGDIQWFTPTEIKTKYVTTSGRKISQEGLKKSSAKLLPKGTLLFTSRATIGDVGISVIECCTNQGFQSFLPNNNNDIEFLYYWIKVNNKEFVRRSSGSTFLEISKNEIRKIKILLPVKLEQQKISSFLSAIDNKIELVNQQIEHTTTWKKGLLQKMFV